MSLLRDRYANKTSQDVKTYNIKSDGGNYFRDAQSAFKWALMGMPQDLESINKAENMSWGDLIGETYPSIGESPSTTVQFAKNMAGELLDLGTKPSSYIAPLVISKAGGAVMRKLAENPVTRDLIEKNIPNVADDFIQQAKYNDWLKTNTPLSSRGLPEKAGNLNLKTFPEDVRNSVFQLVENNPAIGKTPRVSDEQLFNMASSLKDTPTIKYLSNLPEGTLESEALKLRQGNVELIRNALGGELSDLRDRLGSTIEDGLTNQRKMASIFGRGLRQQQLPAETQTALSGEIDATKSRILKDPILSKDKELIGSLDNLKNTLTSKEFRPTLFNKAYNVWINSILSNPMTHIVNTSSNTLFAISKLPEKFASATMDLPLSLFTGKRTHYFGEIPQMIKGAFSPLPTELLPEGTKLDYLAKPIGGIAGKIINTPTDLLQLEDNLSKGLVGRMEYYAQRFAGKTGQELTDAVKNEQLLRTFQDDVSVVGKALMNLRNTVPATRYIIPFIKTPDRVIARGLERTPLVLGKILYKTAKKSYTQEELAKDLGLFSMSSVLAGWVATQYAKGNVTGAAPTDKAEQDAFYRQGKKPNAIRIGTKWIPLERMEPVGSAFSTIVNLIDKYKKSDKDLPIEKAVEAVGGLANTLTTKTYLSGLSNLIKATNDPERYGGNWLNRMASGAIPQGLKFLADIKDPYYREAETALDMMKAKIPIVSETLEPKLNVWGEPVKRSTLNIGTTNNSALEEALAMTPVGFPSKTLGKEKLSAKEYNQILKDSGPVIKAVLEGITADPKWNNLPIEDKEKIVSDVATKIRKVSRMKIRIEREAQTTRENEDTFNNWKQKTQGSTLRQKYGGTK